MRNKGSKNKKQEENITEFWLALLELSWVWFFGYQLNFKQVNLMILGN